MLSTQRDSTKSDMAAKSKKLFLLDYKFIKYTLQFFFLSLACKTGAPRVLKTDGRPVSAFGG